MTSAAALLNRARGASWWVWAVGAGVYFLAVFHRSTLGVAGPQAVQRLDLSAAQLSSFVMLQLGVYAAMQVPTGILVDRFGPRRMLLAATVTMGSAQLLFSQVENYPLALLARGLLGCGDAMTYVSVLRLVAGWFPGRRYPLMVTFTGLAGMTGNVIATVPLTFLLAGFGWTTTFAIAGSLSLAYALLLLRPGIAAPYRQAARTDGVPGGRRVLRDVTGAWRLPAGRLAFWVHLSTMAGPTAFAVLWGFPYLTQALGYRPATASSLLLILVVGGLVANLVIGPLLGRRPAIRGPLAVAVALSCLTGWLTLILWPGGTPPFAVVLVVVACLLRGWTGQFGGLPARQGLQPLASGVHGDRAGQHRRLLRRSGDGLRGRPDPGLGRAGSRGALGGCVPVGVRRDRHGHRARHLPDDHLAAAHQGRRTGGRSTRRGRASRSRGASLGPGRHGARNRSGWNRAGARAGRDDAVTPARDERPPDARPAPTLPPGGGLLLVDKPSGCTSHDVVGRLRHVLRTRRIGHAGTLDPMATGLLVLAVDRSTKLLGHLALTDKTYLATIRLGESTDTDDADGTLVAAVPAGELSDEEIFAGIAALTGPQMQVPSAVSAIKVQGRRAYDLVRAGETVELAARPVTIDRFEVVGPIRRSAEVVDVDVRVDCTTGTYVRSLARDLGDRLGVGGHLTRLRRTRVGPFDVSDAVDVFGAAPPPESAAAAAGPEGRARRSVPRPPVTPEFAAAIAGRIVPAAEAVRRAFPVRTVDDTEAADLQHGRTIPGVGLTGGTYGAFDGTGALVALVTEDAGVARSVLGWRTAG